MKKTTSILLVFVGVALLAVLAVVSWKYNAFSLRERLLQEASVGETISNGSTTDPAQSVGTGTPLFELTAPTDVSTTSISSSSLVASTTRSSTAVSGASTSSVSVTAPVPAPIVPRAGWAVYNEGEYGVAGTYPQSWYEYDAVGLGGSLQFGSMSESSLSSGGFVVNGAAEITVYRTPETVAQAEAEDSLNSTPEAKTTATVAGEPVFVVAYSTASSEDTVTAYVPHGNYLYRIVLSYHGEPSFGTIYNNFLATFQFSY